VLSGIHAGPPRAKPSPSTRPPPVISMHGSLSAAGRSAVARWTRGGRRWSYWNGSVSSVRRRRCCLQLQLEYGGCMNSEFCPIIFSERLVSVQASSFDERRPARASLCAYDKKTVRRIVKIMWADVRLTYGRTVFPFKDSLKSTARPRPFVRLSVNPSNRDR
jgi:hypothetical protein